MSLIYLLCGLVIRKQGREKGRVRLIHNRSQVRIMKECIFCFIIVPYTQGTLTRWINRICPFHFLVWSQGDFTVEDIKGFYEMSLDKKKSVFSDSVCPWLKLEFSDLITFLHPFSFFFCFFFLVILCHVSHDLSFILFNVPHKKLCALWAVCWKKLDKPNK